MFKILALLLLPVICLAQVNSNGGKPTGELLTNEISPNEMKRNASFNLEEIKVRWKKAALENCAGVPCVSVTVPVFTFPGSPTNVTAVAGNTEATVSFEVPSSTGGSAITSYTVTSIPVGGTKSGTGSPLTVTGLTNGTSYTFTVFATNAVGSSVASAASAAVTPAPPPACGSVTSVTIDGYSYPTVSIGTQCWTKENLRVRRYSDGTEIRFDKSGTPAGTVSQTWSGPGLKYGAYTLYEHDSVATPSSNLSNYGYLYNWYAVNGIITDGGSPTKNICPTDWHVPTDTEWTTLTDYLGSSAGTLMKANNAALWRTNTGTNTSGFSALPGGYRWYDGSFSFIRDNAIFWSATQIDDFTAWNRGLNDGNVNVGRNNFGIPKRVGASVRCLRD